MLKATLIFFKSYISHIHLDDQIIVIVILLIHTQKCIYLHLYILTAIVIYYFDFILQKNRKK